MATQTNIYVRHTLPLEQARSAMVSRNTKAAVVVDDNFKVRPDEGVHPTPTLSLSLSFPRLAPSSRRFSVRSTWLGSWNATLRSTSRAPRCNFEVELSAPAL